MHVASRGTITVCRRAAGRYRPQYPRAVAHIASQDLEPRTRALERRLIVLAAVAAWSIVPPYLGPLVGLELDVASSIEIVDHVVPGLCAVVAALIALADARHGLTDTVRALAALGVCALAGLFQTVTHFTLVLHAGEPQAPVAAVVLHASPGPVLLVLSLWLLLRSAPGDTAP